MQTHTIIFMQSWINLLSSAVKFINVKYIYLSICLFPSFNLKVTFNLLPIYLFIKVQSTKYPFCYLFIQVCWLYIADYCPIPSTVYHIFFLSVKVLTVRNNWLSSCLSTIYLILCLSIYLSIQVCWLCRTDDWIPSWNFLETLLEILCSYGHGGKFSTIKEQIYSIDV